jgi:hypothetical protein
VVPGVPLRARCFRPGALCRRGGIARSSRSGRWRFRDAWFSEGQVEHAVTRFER